MADIVLQRGQAYFGQLPRGAVLRVASGTVVLAQHVAVEQTPVVLRNTLHRGAVHVLDAAAWVELQALDDAQLALWVPEVVSAGRLLGQRLRVWRGWLALLRRQVLPK